VDHMRAEQTDVPAQKRKAGRMWDEASLFEKLTRTVGAKELTVARQIYDWM